MAELLRMPEVAANAVEAVLAEWALEERGSFSPEDVLATVETEKAIVEIEAEKEGVLVRTLVPAGATVAVGAPIALVGAPDEELADVDAVLAQLGAEAPPAAEQAHPPAEPAGAPAGAPPPAEDPAPPGGGGVAETAQGRVFASPIARKLARENDLDYTRLNGSGPRGRIRKRDVEAALARRDEPAGAPTAETDSTRQPATRGAGSGGRDRAQPGGAPGYELTEHSRLRRAVAARLTESKQEIPHFYVRGSARVDELVAFRARVNEASEVKVSFNDLILKAVALAHRQHPEMNVVWTDEGVRRYDQVDIAVAIASSRGLVTPVLRGVADMPLTAIALAVRDLAERADAGRLRQEELEGGTSSVSNLGMFGTEEFTAIINPPHSSILSVGAIREEPVVSDGSVEVAKVLRFVLSADHRPIDGSAAAQWMRTFLSVIENPIRIVI